jgi:hypothetical protein
MSNGKISINTGTDIISLRFAYPAVRWFLEAMQDKGDFFYTEDQAGKVSAMTVEGIAKLIHCGYKNDCLVKEIPELFSYEYFFDWCEKAQEDESVKKQIEDVLTCYAGTSYAKKVKEMADEVEKKKTAA